MKRLPNSIIRSFAAARRVSTGRSLVACAALLSGLLFAAAPVHAQRPSFDTNPRLPENNVQRISEHVYVIPGFPNVGIVIGSAGSLVVDTGLGPRNGAIVANEVRKRQKDARLYLTTTHFHPEHAAGEAGFPAGTILIRPKVQQQELERDNGNSVAMFKRNPQFTPYLENVSFHEPDITFDREHRLDLGDVHVRLMWLGPAHTQGDEVIFVEEDRTLLSGDLAMKNIPPRGFAQGSSWQTWIGILDELAALKPLHVVPDHGEWGDASLIDAQKEYLSKQIDTRTK